MHGGQADFFQPGHTYQSGHLRMGEAVWLFRCTEVTRRHNGDRVAHGPGYWGDVSGKAASGTGRMTVAYTPESWTGGWTDITASTSPERGVVKARTPGES